MTNTAPHAAQCTLPRGRRKPPLLIVGAFLSDSTGIRFVCEDLAEGLRARGWAVITTSAIRHRVPRLLDMLGTVWRRRGRYAVAQIDVYSGLAFVWAEVIGASLTALRCPYVLTLHSGAFPDFAGRWPGRVSRLLQSAAAVTSPTDYLKEQMRPYRTGIRVINNGVDMSIYPPRPPGPARPKLVWVRAYERRYNPLLALETVRLLLDEFPDVELVMAGPDTGDWSAGQTLDHARRLGLDGRVRILGPVPKASVPTVLGQGDIFLNTTNVDNAPVTVVEAMACGMCIVTTDAGGVPYLVEHEREALLVPCDDSKAMAAAVRRVLSDAGLAARLSRNARQRAETFDRTHVMSRWDELLVAVAAGERACQ